MSEIPGRILMSGRHIYLIDTKTFRRNARMNWMKINNKIVDDE